MVEVRLVELRVQLAHHWCGLQVVGCRVVVCRDAAAGTCRRAACRYYHIPVQLPPARCAPPNLTPPPPHTHTHTHTHAHPRPHPSATSSPSTLVVPIPRHPRNGRFVSLVLTLPGGDSPERRERAGSPHPRPPRARLASRE
ncbi:unnamed protein product [Danaus chrysippus]|uniref:(African queen) hypothetical protein n=1 Tax=Danaus chrysippus TaxID=151541 RepID=A0A8J2QXD4_9NEOP|nr:unnamed protein product [Danaus chrysippus]